MNPTKITTNKTISHGQNLTGKRREEDEVCAGSLSIVGAEYHKHLHFPKFFANATASGLKNIRVLSRLHTFRHGSRARLWLN
jgi:hypothetical protein